MTHSTPEPDPPTGREDRPLDPTPITAAGHQPLVPPEGGMLLDDARTPTADGLTSGVVFVAGAWLTIAPIALDYAPPGHGFVGYWHDIVLGAVIAVLALLRVLAPRSLPWLSLVTTAVGIWLVFTPVVLGYETWPRATVAAVNAVVVGVVVATAALLSAWWTYRRRDSAAHPPVSGPPPPGHAGEAT
ncbi:SPW repeat domain-containing protein [Saccharothrix obliqua]|uniref:SPW repeat domain-containing protein n=1 Tax=Saccharothrix obliqua TaxID=2861747 RepID=UPI001C5D6805|nr:hypothetical protein [Saccharothrix obliqua]MBW4718774.1 hypothetical protein [Saccharothrix obliqua]